MSEKSRLTPPKRESLVKLSKNLGLNEDLRPLELGLNLAALTEKIQGALLKGLMKKEQISQGRLALLAVLRESGPLTVTELAARLRVAPASASVMIKRLAQAADPLILHEPNAEGGHSYVISLTRRGEELTDLLVKEHLKAMQDFFAVLTAGEQENLLKIMQKLI